MESGYAPLRVQDLHFRQTNHAINRKPVPVREYSSTAPSWSETPTQTSLDPTLKICATEHIHENAGSSPDRINRNALAVGEYPSDVSQGFLANATKQKLCSQKMWNPFWLRTTVLAAFAGLFLFVAVAIITVFVVSVKHQGLSSQTLKYRYSWTYGPTAVFVVITSLWWQVDYWCKGLTPWKNLRVGPLPATRNLLLDYISPILPATLLAATNAGDWAVVASGTGYVLLKVAIVFSTGLFILESRTLSLSGIPLSLESRFSTSSFNWNNLSGSPFSTYYGAATQGLPYPVGTSENLVVPRFSPSNRPTETATYEAHLPGFSTQFECETIKPINVTHSISLPWDSVLARYYVADVRTPICNISSVLVAQGLNHITDFVPTPEQYQGWWSNYTCDAFNGYLCEPGTCGYEPANHLNVLLLSTSLMRWSGNGPGRQPNEWLANMTMIMCKPNYNFNNYTVSYPSDDRSTEQTLMAAKTSDLKNPIPRLQGSDLVLAAKIVAYAENLGANVGNNANLYPLDPLFQLMSVLKGDPKDSPMIKDFMDPALLTKFGTKALSGIMAQIAHDYLLQPANETIFGFEMVDENRLQVKGLTAAVLASLLLICSIISILEIFIYPRDTVSRDPQTLSAAASFLASSTKLHTLSSELNEKPPLRAQPERKTRLFESSVAGGIFEIQFSHLEQGQTSNASKQPAADAKGKDLGWWCPIAVRGWYAALTILIPLLLVAVLQILQHESDLRDGLFGINSRTDARLLVTYIPALVLVSTATFYTTLNFTMAIFAPFQPLRKGGASASNSLTLNLIGRPSIYAFVLSCRNRLLSSASTNLGAFVASFLTIVASGLFVAQVAPLSAPIVLLRQDTFNLLSGNLSSGDSLAGATMNQIVYHKLTYPQWTYEDLVFPRFDLAEANAGGLSPTSTLTVQLPAIRPSLECIVVNPSNVHFWGVVGAVGSYKGPSQMLFDTDVPAPFCQRYPKPGTFEGNDIVQQVYVLPWDGTRTTLGVASNWNWVERNGDVVTQTGGCPTLVISLGTSNLKISPTANFSGSAWYKDFTGGHEIYSFVCYQHMEEIFATVTLQHDLLIDSSHPPVVMEETARSLNYTYGDYSGPEFYYQINNLVGSLAQSSYESDYVTLDPFLLALTQPEIGYPMEELLAEPTKVLGAANRLYSRYMAQVINANFRTKTKSPTTAVGGRSVPVVAAEAEQNTYPGTLTDPDRLRIKQTAPVKWALQGMLVFMALCAAVAYLVSHTRAVLPRYPSPTSIAGAMGLFAGSRLVARGVEGKNGGRSLIPPGAEWGSARHDERNWKGEVFRLGWWKGQDGVAGRRYGVDVGWADGGSGRDDSA